MDEYYKTKDFDSSKCHKEMKDTWIASLKCLTVLLRRVHALVA
jgi:hypothetical protein